ncbi:MULTISPECIES: PadR family transcriptional regulator [Bacteria]|uniref:PadR family transcriptional regulator n=1 Tax=Bacteria TaxID=2 RepID=UPI003C7AF06D
MSVRQSLLAILRQGPCYGYQLRAEFDRRTGSVWPLNVGQIYNTLERLERDGMVARDDVDDQGHVYWRITAAGSAEADAWLSSPLAREQPARDELAIKLALATTLPGADAAALVAAQRAATERRLDALPPATPEPGADPATIASAIVAGSQRAAAEGELRWLDEVERMLSESRPSPLALVTERPRRGRPAGASRH